MSAKNKYGQYFTKGIISDFMVSLIKHPKSSSVLEPSCGKGVFLKSLIDAGFYKLSAYEIDKSLNVPYSFVRYKSFLSASTDEKYDIIIGNPPYIRWKNLEDGLKEELSRNSLWNKYFNSLCDYLFIFILKSIEHLNRNGELIFICSDYWFNTTHSATLRDYMIKNGHFSDIFHFKEAPLFENVTASLIIFRYIKSKAEEPDINLYRYKGQGMPTLDDLLSRKCFTHSNIPQFKEGERWILAEKNEQDKIMKLERKCSYRLNLFDMATHTIGEVCNIGNGMVSGLDKAFRIPNDICLNDFERKNSIYVLKAKDLHEYTYKDKSRYIMIREKLSEEQFINQCPHFARLLVPYKDELNKRYNYNRDIPYWEFAFPRNYGLFSTHCNKIFVPCKERISNKEYFRFSFVEDGVFALQDVTGIVKKSSCKESLEYILAYLNTREVFEWINLKGIVKGDIIEFSEAPIASIPFRIINWKNKDETVMHDTITNEMREYIKDNNLSHMININNIFSSFLS